MIADLYQQLILDHTRHPHNKGIPATFDKMACGYNPLCGDKVTLYLKLNKDVNEDLHFEGSGCAISTASVSILTDFLKGKKISEIPPLFKSYQDLVTGKQISENEKEILEKMVIFEGVKEFPMRVKCATLSWHTLKAALENKPEPVSTE